MQRELACGGCWLIAGGGAAAGLAEGSVGQKPVSCRGAVEGRNHTSVCGGAGKHRCPPNISAVGPIGKENE